VTEQVNLVDIDEVAKQLKVSVSTVRSWLRAGLIPENTYIHVGKTYRFDLNRVIFALMNTDFKETNDVIENMAVSTLANELAEDMKKRVKEETNFFETPEVDEDL
jgi:excisionase family DNA binding protein